MMLIMMRKSMQSNHRVADKRVERSADQASKLSVVPDNAIMVSPSKISAEEMEQG